MARKKEPSYVTEQYTFPSLLRKLMDATGTKQKELAQALGVKPQTVSLYAQGQSFPDVNNLAKIAQFFDVSADYLIGRSPNPTVKEDIQVACKTTGLSEDSVKVLRSLNEWGFTEEARVIDFLLFDDTRRYPGHDFRGILSLLHFFLKYDDEQAIKKQVSINGAFRDVPNGSIGVSIDSIQIDQRIIENAVLNEIQQALISVKRKLLEDRKAANNGKH